MYVIIVILVVVVMVVLVMMMMEGRLRFSDRIILNSYIIYTPKITCNWLLLVLFFYVSLTLPPHICFRNYATHKNLYPLYIYVMSWSSRVNLNLIKLIIMIYIL